MGDSYNSENSGQFSWKYTVTSGCITIWHFLSEISRLRGESQEGEDSQQEGTYSQQGGGGLSAL